MAALRNPYQGRLLVVLHASAACEYCGPQHGRGIVKPMIRILTTGMIGLGLALSGCATYSTSECSGGDWSKIGLQDGRDGRTEDRFNQHGKACSLDRSEESRAAYLAGRKKGLATYCTDVRGYREAALGQKYYGVCPPETAKQFSRGYQLGSRLRQLETQLGEISNAYFGGNAKRDKNATPQTQNSGLQQEQARLKSNEARLRADLKLLRDKADAMVRAARKKKK